MERIFHAESIAIIGASLDEKKRGYQAIKTLLETKFDGDIYPINPTIEKILGLKCYTSVLEVHDRIDLALITTPSKTIPHLLEECGQKGIAGAVIIAGGFGETGDSGKTAENEIVEIAEKYHIRLIGPNTSGMISLHDNLNLVGLEGVPKGDIALLSQSGNIALHLITEAKLRSQKGFTYYVGVGNEADLKFHEYLEFFKNDPKTKAILMYVEGLREGRKFLQQAYLATTEKPIILLKSGRSQTGKQSAGSHTGALAGISEVARTAFARAGIINIENADELFPVAETLANLEPIKENRVAILADGGGHATIASDILTDYGIEIPQLNDKTQAKLKKLLPPNASVQNPIDVAGGTDSNPAIFADCAKILLEDEQVDGLLIVGLFGGYGIRFSEKLTFMEEDAAHQMGKLMKKVNKPIILQSLYNSVNTHSLRLLRYYDIPVYDSLDIACKCMSALCQYGNYLNSMHKKRNFVFSWGAKANPKGQAIVDNIKEEKRKAFLEHEAKELLNLHKAPALVDRVAKNSDEAVKIAKELGGDVVLKIVSPDILHKSDAGGVMLNLKNEKEVKHAYNQIIKHAKAYDKNAHLIGCLVSPMLGEGVEVIIGTKIDEQFGPVIMFGLGGILVEVVKDVSFRVLPLSKGAAKKMISEIKSSAILDGVRGKPPVDKKALIELLLTVSEIIEAYPDIKEMDLNPVIAHETGLSIADARIILKEKEDYDKDWN
ncbi:MAG: acyl-CoA synthetase [bacterium]|nr:acyl-CoA synthetase [bacterium]